MDAIGKVYGGCTRGEVYNIALRRENKNLVGEHIYFKVVEEILRVGVLLCLQKAAHPRELLLVAAFDALLAGFVFPVRGNAVFRGQVHFPCAYLYLKGYALRADNGGVYALIHIWLGR